MDNPEAVKLIIGQLKTKKELVDFAEKIENLRTGLYQTSQPRWEEKIDQEFGPQLSQILKTFSNLNLAEKDRLLKQVLIRLREIRTVKLALALTATTDLVELIHQRLGSILNQDFVLEIEVDPQLLGGLIIEIGGRFQDFSLKKRFEDYFKTSHA